jgi:PEP-CTERM motif
MQSGTIMTKITARWIASIGVAVAGFGISHAQATITTGFEGRSYGLNQQNSGVAFCLTQTCTGGWVGGWNVSTLSLNVNANNTAAMTGTTVRQGVSYSFNFSFLDPYKRGNDLYWGDFSGTLRNLSNNTVVNFADVQGGRGTWDARMGINSAPTYYPGGMDGKLQFGFWAANPSASNPFHNGDVNVSLTEKPSQVPLPGTLALLGLGLMAGAAARKCKA